MHAIAFRPAPLLRNAHVQTVRAALVPRPLPSMPPGALARFTAPDGEPLLARINWQPGPRDAAPAAVLVHGLEGSAESHYMRGAAAKLYREGFHVVRLNQRGCGESEALTPTLHHGGRSDDLAAVIRALSARDGVASLAAIGFSLGGNLLLKLLGERGKDAGLVAAAALSPLLNPQHVQIHLDRPSSVVYRRFFLRLMARRMQRRAALFPRVFPSPSFSSRTVLEFDERFTVPYIGYASAADYYRRADALPLLGGVEVPTLLLHAEDDPIVPFAGLTPAVSRASRHVNVELPRRGGHLGFYAPGPGTDGFWAEDRAVAFLCARLSPRRRAPIAAFHRDPGAFHE